MTQWVKIVLVGLIGGAIGFLYAYLQPVKYIAKMTFVVEDTKSSGGGLASLVGQFGFDIGGGGGGSIFSGDNILVYFKSESLIKEALLTEVDKNTKQTLADIWVGELNKKSKNIENNKHASFSDFKFNQLSRNQDSILTNIVKQVIGTIDISRLAKNSSFIVVKIKSLNEKFSKILLERLVTVATMRYVESKTKIKSANVALLQRKSDSLVAVLNDKTYIAAASEQILIDANPALKINGINSEISLRDKTIAATLFAEVVKNLEFSKTILSQETPVIQIIDQATFPLEKEKTSKLKSLILGGFLAGFLTILYLLASKWLKSQLPVNG